MRHLLLAVSATCLAAGASAQCGTVQLTSPPNFVDNNGGAVGGMVYFTLDVLTTTINGVSICGFELNTGVNGAPISGQVQIHQSISDWNLLTAANNTAADWCTVACVSGTGMGSGNPSPVSIINGTNSLDLPPGQYLIAIGGGNFDHDYTNGNGANQFITNGTLAFDAGKGSNTQYGTTLFTPRVANITIDYDVATSPVTLSPCGQICKPAVCEEVGTGCGGAPNTIAELFDGGNPWDLNDPSAVPPTSSDVVMQASSGTVVVLTAPGTAIVPPAAPDLGLGDDASSALIPLGFSLSDFGVCADAISVQSNGCIWLGAVGSGDFSESLAEFESQEARIAGYWDDLRPLTGGGGGTIHVDQTATETRVTYNAVFIWGGTVPVTFQVVITASQITVRYDPLSAFRDSALVGFHNGVTNAGTLSSDLTVGAVTGFGSQNLNLLCVNPPIVGAALNMDLTHIPDGGIGAVLAEIGVAGPGVPLPPPVRAGCLGYLSPNALNLGLVLNAMFCTRYPYRVNIPNDNSLLNLPITAQGAAYDPVANDFLTSNAIDSSIGNS